MDDGGVSRPDFGFLKLTMRWNLGDLLAMINNGSFQDFRASLRSDVNSCLRGSTQPYRSGVWKGKHRRTISSNCLPFSMDARLSRMISPALACTGPLPTSLPMISTSSNPLTEETVILTHLQPRPPEWPQCHILQAYRPQHRTHKFRLPTQPLPQSKPRIGRLPTPIRWYSAIRTNSTALLPLRRYPSRRQHSPISNREPRFDFSNCADCPRIGPANQTWNSTTKLGYELRLIFGEAERVVHRTRKLVSILPPEVSILTRIRPNLACVPKGGECSQPGPTRHSHSATHLPHVARFRRHAGRSAATVDAPC